ncbi:Phosphoenolpyruvate-dependent sugar phosphotransferase system, EIIA 2 [Trichococcus ilyis]|uniref:Phosphoenolpyruvate-dependent sugar phosphotransferase system eiia 2 n=1 Tax=Trichococcus ilyis TaxID=640938 RepID=A0A143ZAC6_9LACT|nr:phosphoenolpyruvate-dependent sugar phosphotransferase system eiia 2 [Trichococcus ilyis]SEJ96254.1 Phosphoenolpyruvate-dependent sugar phosphotransferase system, EIIA 2 [Trichococcus ilyis]
MPLAPSEFGSKELAMEITVLNTPIAFGNEANDPVKYLFFLSAKDSNTHLESLAQLVDLLEDSHFYTMLDTATEASQILDYIKDNENKKTEEE